MFDIYHEWVHHAKIYFLNEYGSNLRIHKIVWVKQSLPKIEFNKTSYILNFKKSMFTRKNNPMLFFKLNNPEPISFDAVRDTKGSGKELQAFIKDTSTSEILNEGQQQKTLLIIGLFVLVIVGISAYSMFMLNQQNQEIANLSLKLAETYMNSTKAVGPGVKIP